MLHADLSARQCRLVELAATGLPGPELASLFELSHKRVRQCLIDLYRVTGAEGRMDLAWWHWQTQGRAALTDEARTDARTRFAGLQPGEQVLARLVAERLSNRDVARCLGVSVKTVCNRLSDTYELLEVPGRVALARLVWEADLDA